MDMWTEIQRQEKDNDDSREARARVAASAVARENLVGFIEKGQTQRERDLRLDLTEVQLRNIVGSVAEQYNVNPVRIYQAVREKLAAETAVTKPKTVKPDSPIGGQEGKKYQDTKEVPEEAKADGETDTGSKEPVVEEPVRHKLESDDLNSDTQKDNKPASLDSTRAKGKSFPEHSSSTKESMPVSRRDFEAIAKILRANGADPGIIEDIADYFESQNPNFDRERFNEAAYLTEQDKFNRAKDRQRNYEKDWSDQPFAPRDKNREY